MKKIFTILTVLSVIGVVLAGCGGGDNAGAKTDTPAKTGTDAPKDAGK